VDLGTLLMKNSGTGGKAEARILLAERNPK
jgi:hypothetical protein